MSLRSINRSRRLRSGFFLRTFPGLPPFLGFSAPIFTEQLGLAKLSGVFLSSSFVDASPAAAAFQAVTVPAAITIDRQAKQPTQPDEHHGPLKPDTRDTRPVLSPAGLDSAFPSEGIRTNPTPVAVPTQHHLRGTTPWTGMN